MNYYSLRKNILQKCKILLKKYVMQILAYVLIFYFIIVIYAIKYKIIAKSLYAMVGLVLDEHG